MSEFHYNDIMPNIWDVYNYVFAFRRKMTAVVLIACMPSEEKNEIRNKSVRLG